MTKIKISIPLVPFYPCGDRFSNQYKKDIPFEKKLELVSKIKDISGIELSYPSECNNPQDLIKLLNKYNLEVSCIEVDTFSLNEFKYGSLISNNQKIREKAINLCKECIDFANEVGCKQVSLWLGQDGYDYPWQIDYHRSWIQLIESLKKIVDYDSNMNIIIEYKPREPRNFILISNAAKCMNIFNEIDRNNFGCLLDLGHSFNAKENPAEEVSLLSMKNKLFHIHLNDNYGYWDDDLALGTINLSQTLEFLYYLKQNNYSGWYSFDIFPYREEGFESIKSNVNILKKMIKLVDCLDSNFLRELQDKKSICSINKYIMENLLK